MTNETPTMPDTAFNHSINFIKLDVCIRLLSELVPCSLINKDELEETVTYLRVLHKEISDAFDVLATENPQLQEEQMGGDQEGDVHQDRPIDFKEVV